MKFLPENVHQVRTLIISPPEWAVDLDEFARRQVFSPPNGDMLDDTIRAADMVVSKEEGYPVIRGYARIEGLEDTLIELSLWTPSLPPFSINVYKIVQ